LTDRNDVQPPQHVRVVPALSTDTAGGLDQADFVVVAQSRRRHVGYSRHLADRKKFSHGPAEIFVLTSS
jgi:hypothetical protein